MRRGSLIICVVMLVVVSSTGTMITAERQETPNRSSNDCYHLFDTPPSALPLKIESKTYDAEGAREVSQMSNDGLMDSPWPMFSHDVRHTGQSPYNATTGTQIKWTMETYRVPDGGPIIDKNGTIYFGAGGIYAVYPNGTLKWKYETNYCVVSPAAIDRDGTIYFGDVYAWPTNYLFALYSNGTLKWKYPTGDVLSSPAIGEDGTIYFGTADTNSYLGAIIALNPNGNLRWEYHTDDRVLSSPAIGQDGTIYCGCQDTYFYALYPNNGSLKWKFQTGNRIRSSPSIGDDGTIYFVSLDGYLYALDLNGSMKWKTDVGAGTSPTIGRDGTIYAGWDYLHAINPSDGSIKWKWPVPNWEGIEGGTPCTSKNGTIYFTTINNNDAEGHLYALNPNGSLAWQLLIDRCESAPAIGEDGTIYFGDWSDHIYAIGSGEQKKIEILTPKRGHIYVFNHDYGQTLRNKTVIVGSATFTVKVYDPGDLINLSFYFQGLRSTLTNPPFEWNMNHRYGQKLVTRDIVTVIANYKGGFSWTESIYVVYFHLGL